MGSRAFREKLQLFASWADDVSQSVHTAPTKDSIGQLADLISQMCLFLLEDLGDEDGSLDEGDRD